MWKPALYHQFKVNFAPFKDVVSLVAKRHNQRVVDLGCGSGTLTRQLADTLPDSDVLGVDTSPEMLQEARTHARKGLRFEQSSIDELLARDVRWDLVFSHAALHWVDDHRTLLSKIVSRIAPGGQLAVQMVTLDALYFKRELDLLAGQDPFRSGPWASPVLSSEEYATILFQNGATDITAFEKVYPCQVKNADAVYDYASTTVMIYHLKRLPLEQHKTFKEEFKKMLRCKYPETPLFFPQKRLILAATFPAKSSADTQHLDCSD